MAGDEGELPGEPGVVEGEDTGEGLFGVNCVAVVMVVLGARAVSLISGMMIST